MITIPPSNGNIVPLSEKDRAVIEAISMYVNNGGIHPIKAGKALTEIHRALHGTVLKLFIGWCRQMALNHYRGKVDDRNRTVARKVSDVYEILIEQKLVDDPNFVAESLGLDR